MQASFRWAPPTGTLGRIVAEARERAAALESRLHELAAKARDTEAGPSLAAALRTTSVAVIAEVKRRSPSKGVIAESLGAVDTAKAYQRGGAAAISVLTEPAHFGGHTDDLVAVRAALEIPALKKDFHVAPVQLVEARALGASAALLIVRALSPDELGQMMEAGRALGLELLVEIRDEIELDRALLAGATIIGVNNRDLETLKIDPSTSERIVPLIPADIIAIAESGISSRADVERYAACGTDAVLVGSSLSASSNPTDATHAIANVPRRTRGG